MIRLKLKINESVLNEWTTSTCIALLERHVYKAPFFLISFRSSFNTNSLKLSTSQYVNGGSIHILSLGKSAIFCCWSCPPNCFYLSHLPIIDCANELQLMIQKPVIPRPACATLSWHHVLSIQWFWRTLAKNWMLNFIWSVTFSNCSPNLQYTILVQEWI